jgi:hypothetical protein
VSLGKDVENRNSKAIPALGIAIERRPKPLTVMEMNAVLFSNSFLSHMLADCVRELKTVSRRTAPSLPACAAAGAFAAGGTCIQ